MLLLLTFINLSSSSSPCQISNCMVCSFRNPFFCNNCSPGFVRTLEGCSKSSVPIQISIENCLSTNIDKTCSICKPGYDLISNTCEPICEEDCFCFEANTCVDSNFLPSVKGKDDRNLAYCYDCDYCNTFTGYCNTCSESYYNYYGTCYTCGDAGCSSCYGYDDCYDCKNSYYLSSGYCYECRSHCKVCYGYYSCSECESDYKYEDGRCIPKTTSKSIIIAIIAPIITFVILIAIVICIVCCVKNYRKRKSRNHQMPVANYSSIANPQYVISAPVAPLIIGTQGYQSQAFPGVNIPYSSSRIDSSNFLQMVPLVILDSDLRYMGEGTCKICQNAFKRDIETRTLPCGHAFHGMCIYNNVAVGNNKYCLLCNRQYY